MQLERVKLNDWLEELLSVYPFPPHITLEKHLDPANPSLDIDVVEVQQAIRNLIGNGLRCHHLLPAQHRLALAGCMFAAVVEPQHRTGDEWCQQQQVPQCNHGSTN